VVYYKSKAKLVSFHAANWPKEEGLRKQWSVPSLMQVGRGEVPNIQQCYTQIDLLYLVDLFTLFRVGSCMMYAFPPNPIIYKVSKQGSEKRLHSECAYHSSQTQLPGPSYLPPQDRKKDQTHFNQVCSSTARSCSSFQRLSLATHFPS